MGKLKGSIPDFAGLLTEDGAEKLFLCRGLTLSLGAYLSYQDVSGSYLCADTDDTALIQVLERVAGYAGNFTGDILLSKLCISALALIFFKVDGCIDIILHKSL